jgi:pimeloyl-ACP methyl ester carboxylesterase
VVVGQQPYAIDPDGPLDRVVAGALGGPGTPTIEPLVTSFESMSRRYPPEVRDIYLASDAAAMRAAWRAAMMEGAVSDRLGEWRVPVLLCVAANDVDFVDQARRAATEIPGAELAIVEDADHLGMDTADVDPAFPAVLRTLRRAAP